MQLSYTLWLNDHIGRCDRLGNGEVGRVNLPPLASTTRGRFRCMLKSPVDVRGITSQLSSTASDCSKLGTLPGGAIQNVRVFLRQLVKGRLRHTKALSQNRFWGFC